MPLSQVRALMRKGLSKKEAEKRVAIRENMRKSHGRKKKKGSK